MKPYILSSLPLAVGVVCAFDVFDYVDPLIGTGAGGM